MCKPRVERRNLSPLCATKTCSARVLLSVCDHEMLCSARVVMRASVSTCVLLYACDSELCESNGAEVMVAPSAFLARA